MEDWININDKWPEKYQEVIICTNEGIVKSSLHMGNAKFSTYLQVAYWMPMPEAPKIESQEMIEETQPKKKRGRPKNEKKRR